jgi:predicted amidohydrolase YtcJ
MRRYRFSSVLVPFFSICMLSVVWASDGSSAEHVLYNGKVFTGEPDHPYAQAVAIRGDKIVAVGTNAQAKGAVGKGADNTDLQGRCLLPGLIDSHQHAIDGGVTLLTAEVDDPGISLNDLVTFAAESRKNGKGMRGDVLYITGLSSGHWADTAGLSAHFNTGAYAHLPLLLAGSDGHTGWANRILLQRAGVTQDFLVHASEIERSYYGFDRTLEPNGFLVDAGLDKVSAKLPDLASQLYLEAGRAAVQYNHRLGITAWLDPLATEADLQTYRQLAELGELEAHVAAFPEVHPRSETDPLARIQSIRKDYGHVPNLTVPGFKIFADGVVEIPAQTAAMSKPYKNTGLSGELLFDPVRFSALVTAADKQGLIVHVHAIGDRAVHEVLTAFEAARTANGNSGLPHTITHVQFASPTDIPRFAQLGIIAALQLFWATAEEDSVELVRPYIDPTIYEWMYPARSLLDAGSVISGASDWPVSTANVFEAIYQAETRKGAEGVLIASERMPREAMLYAYTRNSARAMNQLSSIGTIAVGKQADLVLVDRDVLTVSSEELKDTKILWTMFGGKFVYRAGQGN